MKPAVIIMVAIFIGCSAQEQALLQDKLPQLILQDPLPPLVSGAGRELRMDLRLLIDEKGNVAYAELVRAAVDPAWDSLARAVIYRWKFSPALANGKPFRVWMRFPAIVQFAEPKIMELAEIVCESRAIADSLYMLLHWGDDFSVIAKKHSRSESALQGGLLGKVNIRRYPKEVQEVLTDVRDGAFTSPLRLGNHFIIFKRFPSVL